MENGEHRMGDGMWEERVSACSLCGGPIVIQGRITKFHIAVNEDFFAKIMEANCADEFVYDRLRRAERIIVDLRKKVTELETENRG